MKKLVTDDPKGNGERLMNLAYTKDREVWIRVDGGRKLTHVAAEYAKLEGCQETTPEGIMDGDCLDCDCPVALMYALAIQAATLRDHLKVYEDIGLDTEELYRAMQENRLVILPAVEKGTALRFKGEKRRADHWNILLTAFADNPNRTLRLMSIKEVQEALEAETAAQSGHQVDGPTGGEDYRGSGPRGSTAPAEKEDADGEEG